MKSAQKKQEDTRLYYRFMVMLGVERRRMDGSGRFWRTWGDNCGSGYSLLKLGRGVGIEVGKHEEMYSLGMVCGAYLTYSNAKH